MSLPPFYLALGRDIVGAIGPQALDQARRFGPEAARRQTVQALDALLERIPPERLRPVACARGCAFCCHRQVAVGAAEVFALLDHLRASLDAGAFAAFARRCSETAAEVGGLSRDERARRSIPCPVLADGACSGHPARPFRCRAYNSLDVEPCRRLFAAPQADDPGPPADLDRYVLAQASMFGLYAGLERAGFDPRQYELVTALAEALDDTAAAARYRRGEQAFLRASVFG